MDLNKVKAKRERMKETREILESLITGLSLTSIVKFKYIEYSSNLWIFEKTNQLYSYDSKTTIDMRPFRIDVFYNYNDELYLEFNLKYHIPSFDIENCDELLDYQYSIDSKKSVKIKLNNQEDISKLILILIEKTNIGVV